MENKEMLCKKIVLKNDFICSDIQERRFCQETLTETTVCVPMIDKDYIDANKRLAEVIQGLNKKSQLP